MAIKIFSDITRYNYLLVQAYRELAILKQLSESNCAFAPNLIKAYIQEPDGNQQDILSSSASITTEETNLSDFDNNLKQINLVLIMEHMPYDLDKLFLAARDDKVVIEPKHVVNIFFNICTGVKLLHDSGLIHRDLKSSNILIDDLCQIKIADYGLARKTPKNKRDISPHAYSRPYRAPEVSLNE